MELINPSYKEIIKEFLENSEDQEAAIRRTEDFLGAINSINEEEDELNNLLAATFATGFIAFYQYDFNF